MQKIEKRKINNIRNKELLQNNCSLQNFLNGLFSKRSLLV